jgi:hypothetical protein
MQFLLQQQAQFSADPTRISTKVDRLSTNVEQLSTKTDLIAEGLIGLTGIVGRLVEAQARTDEQLKETDQRLSGHMNVVIEMFELRTGAAGIPACSARAAGLCRGRT